MSGSIDPEICPFCKEKLKDGADVCQIRQKGADGINSASVQRGDTIVVTAGSKVHLNCRKRYTNPIEIKTQQSKTKRHSIPLERSSRASAAPFNSKTDCLFCGITIVPGSSDYKN